jgi:hypothetical protein
LRRSRNRLSRERLNTLAQCSEKIRSDGAAIRSDRPPAGGGCSVEPLVSGRLYVGCSTVGLAD